MNNEPTHLDLFSGICGFSIAAQWAGFSTVGFCEIEPYAQAVIKARFGAVANAADAGQQAKRTCSFRNRSSVEAQLCYPRLTSDIFTLRGTDYAGVDLITGGFPCQPFSVAGKRRGAADDRAIWPQMLRVIAEARPGWVLAENVPGIINMELDRVLSDLEAIGYSIGTLVIPACAVDAKHRRDRVWIVANSKHSGRCWRHSKRGWPDSTVPSSKDAPDSIGSGLEIEQRQPGNDGPQQPATERDGHGWCRWEPEPDVGRVAHGIPRRVDRLKALGNAIVPQVAYQILRHIRSLIPK